jgi:hypothetical protein
MKGSGGRSRWHHRGGPRRGIAHFVNAAAYVISHDTESGNEQRDAYDLLKAQLPGDTEINLIEHESLGLKVVQTPGASTEQIA